ncbi:hypothetical protein [Rhizobacter sp. Root404]|uniref:hypothetical protein n=1 Tax=Rhizobacter sp. Root404 TaxID=1736528 RepID=UPI0006FE6DE1|nr:hypothetical protein [Rhizobacter sp. Root404]KQW40248.1 hypothetical protein ASC76_02040 [Rhizobacter sp. Root404]
MSVDAPALQTPRAPSLAAPRWQQLRLSILFLLVIATTFAGLCALSNSAALESASARLQLEQWQRTNGLYAYHPLSRDSGEYLLLRDMPRADLARAGVVYIGSSTLQHAVKTWDLPADARQRVHNFAIESANLREQYMWVQYLMDHRGLGRAGSGKTLVILGVSHLDTRDKLPGTRDSKFVDELFARYGLFDYEPSVGISPKPLFPLQRRFVEESARASGFLHQLPTDLFEELRARAGRGSVPSRPQSDEDAMKLQRVLMGGDAGWRGAIQHQTGFLEKTIRLLQSRGIEVQAVVLPMKAFNDRQPFAAAFSDAARSICDRLHVPLNDSSRALTDAEFADGTHLNYVGQTKFSPFMLAPALKHLGAVDMVPVR